MKFPQLFSLGFLLPLVLQAEAPQGLRPGDLVAICGDSITEQRRYSLYMADYLLMCQPQPDLRTVQLGIGGENSTMFLKRLGDDILPFKPAVVTTCYGMNDGGYAPSTPEMLALYRKSAEGIVAGLKKAGVRFILLGSPGAVDSFACAKVDPTIYNKTLGELADISREVAAENGVTFVDVHSLMLDTMAKAKAKYGPGYMVAGTDGIHPGENGHVIMAYAFLKALGCRGDIGTITVDAKSGKAEATAGHAVVSAAKGVVEIESTRYPFCFYGKPEDPAATSGMIEFLPFNQELNRYLLVVKNAPAQKLKVTWGTQSREFSAESLEKGINLAAEFPLNNPFSEAFSRVQSVLSTQQTLESRSLKLLLASLREWQTSFPEIIKEKPELVPCLRQRVVDRSAFLVEESSKSVKPVRHTLKIEPAS